MTESGDKTIKYVTLQSRIEMCYKSLMRNDDYSLIWKALAEPIRREILDMLRERPHTTGEIAQAFDVSRFAIMKHLTTLEQSGLITVRKQGRERWNTLNPVPLQLIYERWMRPYEAMWSHSLLQLKTLVERGNDPNTQKDSSSTKNITIKFRIDLQASQEQVFDALTQHIAAWWGHPYVHHQATNITLEPWVGGRLYESWGNTNDGILWGTVQALHHPHALSVVGSLGMTEPTYGVMIFHLESSQDNTALYFTLDAFGKINPQIRRSYEAGWKDQLGIRLRALVERDVHYGLDQGAHGWFMETRPTDVEDKQDTPITERE